MPGSKSNRSKFAQPVKQSKVSKSVKKCVTCFRPIKGHPRPCGKLCSLEPLYSAAELENMSQEKHKLALGKDRKKKVRKRLHQSNERYKLELEKDRKKKVRKRLQESNETHEKRLLTLRLVWQRKRKCMNYEAWCDPKMILIPKPKVDKLSIPKMSMVCSDCGALMFPFELHRKKPNGEYTFSLCCNYGCVNLPSFKDPPDILQDLLISDSHEAKTFRQSIRAYNSMLSMASRNITGKETDFGNSRGPPVFKVSGSMYHLSPNVLPEQGQEPKFAQIYVYDREQQIDSRLKSIKHPKPVDRNTLGTLQDMLEDCNFYVKQYQSAAKIFESRPTEDLRLVMKSTGSKGAKKKTFMPDVADVVVIAPGDQTERRDVILYRSKGSHPNSNDTVRIHEFHKSYDPTAYVLILPYGDDGYNLPAPLQSNGRTLTAMDFYCYHLMVRDSSFNTLHWCGRLYQEYICDMYSKVEGARLKYIQENQDKLRVELYSGLEDAVAHAAVGKESEEERIGQMIVLPASFTGSPRFSYKHYLDALAICREYRRFDLFITITCNPVWESIKENIFAGQYPHDRPDIMNRIFNYVVQSLIDDLKKGCLGPLKARLHTIEGQFRGLKHAHILALLSIILTVDDIDFIIQAQIPDEKDDPELHEAVSTFMLHGPCGPGYSNAPCMKNGMCSKGFPKNFQETTVLPNDGHGYPLYARPNNGRIIVKNGFHFDNRWVVPYNRYLLLKFWCHINVEFIGNFATVKYIYKYVHKGTDVSTTEIQGADRDEIAKFLNARTIDPYDATWRLFGYKVQDRYPAVQQLAIHEEGQQSVIFKEGEAKKALETVKDTTLLAFFKFNSSEPEARSIKYQDFPKFCTFVSNSWKWRKVLPTEENSPRTIGRINSVTISGGKILSSCNAESHDRGYII